MSATGSAVLDDVAEVIGVEPAFALAWEYIGVRLFVPKDTKLETSIEATIGVELGARFREAFSGTAVTFPYRVVLEHHAARLRAQGVTVNEIARRLKTRETRVYDILRRLRERV